MAKELNKEAIAKARAEFRAAILEKNVKNERYEVLKNKTSQLTNGVNNSMIVEDLGNGNKFSISLSATVIWDNEEDVRDPEADTKLANLQAAFKLFLSTIHDKI